MPWGTRNIPPKKILAGVPLVIGVTLMQTPTRTRTQTRTSVKQYVEPPEGGGEGGRHKSQFELIYYILQ